MKTGYERVIPRDLFNEAKLLKCLGRLALLKHDNVLNDNVKIEHDNSEHSGFNILQDESDGSIYVSNFHLIVNDERIPLHTSLNSRDNYPLFAIYEDSEHYVFNEDGDIMPCWLQL